MSCNQGKQNQIVEERIQAYLNAVEYTSSTLINLFPKTKIFDDKCNQIDSIWREAVIFSGLPRNSNIEILKANIIDQNSRDTCFLYEINNISIPKQITQNIHTSFKIVGDENTKIKILIEEFLFQEALPLKYDYFNGNLKNYMDSSNYYVEVTKHNSHKIKYKSLLSLKIHEVKNNYTYDIVLEVYIPVDK